MRHKKIKKVIITVAGFGTRFLPVTKAQPKEMLPLVDKPVIQYLIEEAVASGIKEVIFITGRGKRAIEDHFDNAAELETYLESRGKGELARQIREISSLAHFAFVRQKEPKGAGDAILQARHLIGHEPVAVLYGDDIVDSKVPCLKQLIDVYEKYGTPVLSLEVLLTTGSGLLSGTASGALRVIKNPPTERIMMARIIILYISIGTT